MLIDERVLTADFQPSEILHRHDEISTLSRTLQPISDGEIDSSAGAFIWGPTGTGKSCTTAYLLKHPLRGYKLSKSGVSRCYDIWTRPR